jgi:hypothetical protein
LAEQSSNDLQIYDSWDLARPSITPRSRLYHIEPLGLGTPQTESFTSYLARLAYAHCLTVGVLFCRELFPQSNIPELTNRANRRHTYPNVAGYWPLNGKGRTARQWVKVIERLTQRKKLSALTMLRWQKTLSDNPLLRKNRAWCSACLQERRHNKQTAYENLLWTLSVVKYCPEHRVRLQTVCRHCNREESLISHKLIPGLCSRCLAWLGNDETSKPVSGTLTGGDLNYQLWIAEQMGLLIAAAHGMKSDAPADSLSIFLKGAFTEIGYGNWNAFARYLGVTANTCSSWQSMKSLPQVDSLLRICYVTGTSITNVLTDCSTVHRISRTRIPESTLASGRFKPQEIKIALLNALARESPPSVRDVARSLGLKCTHSLRSKHSELCKRLTSKYREKFARSPSPRKRRFLKSSEIHSALQEALREKPLPSAREVARRLGYASSRPLIKRFPDLSRRFHRRSSTLKTTLEKALAEPIPQSCDRIVQRIGYAGMYGSLRAKHTDLWNELAVRQREFRVRKRTEIRDSLESVLLEDPPPSFDEIAKRLGYKNSKSSSMLMKYFPELCKAIKTRYGNDRAAKIAAVGLHLNDALIEHPPPSWKEVVSRLGYSEDYIRSVFREKAKAIKKRYRQFRRSG